jgi:hypothetical protein
MERYLQWRQRTERVERRRWRFRGAAFDCVGGWLKGEAREFRDGTRREVENVRAGFDRIGRGLSSLGSKLRRSD